MDQKSQLQNMNLLTFTFLSTYVKNILKGNFNMAFFHFCFNASQKKTIT